MKEHGPPSMLQSAFYGYSAGAVYFILALVTNIAISRLLGARVLGEYYFVITVNTVITNFASLGIGLSNTTFLARKEHGPAEMHAVSLVYSLLLGATAIGLFFLAKAFLPALHLTVSLAHLSVAVIVLPFTIYARYWNSMMIGLDRIASLSLVLTAASILWNALTLAAVFMGYGLPALFGAWFIYLVIQAAAMALMMRREGGPLRCAPSLLWKSLSFGFRGNLGEVATELWKKLDVFLVYTWCGAEQVGYYSVALTMVDKYLQATIPVRMAITPKIAGHEREESLLLTARASRLILAFSLAAAVFLALFAWHAIFILYGSAFLLSVTPFRILLAGSSVLTVAVVLSICFIGQLKRPGLLSLLAWINVALNCVFCMILVPSFGIAGAALSTSVTCILGTAFVVYLFHRITAVPLRSLLVVQREDLAALKDVIASFKKKRVS
ncbi:MAG: oligosaccharide flippase family protein [Candidatus Eremiobacteraeota bacterium]|nr:oligosaccharide flippase family protein [Candidatus Eremiobacteraeota bacterium]